MPNKTLVERLFNETQILKIEYLEQMKIWAEKEFVRLEKVAEKYPSYTEMKAQFPGSDTLYSTAWSNFQKHCKSVMSRYEIAKRITDKGIAAFKTFSEKQALNYYENSIKKLAARIEKKNLDQAKMTMQTGRVGVNIETVLTDGSKTVKAWTIIASGAVQKPHYRYLVK